MNQENKQLIQLNFKDKSFTVINSIIEIINYNNVSSYEYMEDI